MIPAAFAAAAFGLFLLPGLLGPYGFFIDELYYLSCAGRLAWGYVDHPPLAPFLLSLSRGLLGNDLLALRLPAAAAGALTVLGSGLVARRLGAGRGGQAIACAAMLLCPGLYVMTSFFSMNAFEIVFWLGLLWLASEIELRDQPRLWLALGALAGVAFLNKHTVVVLLGAVGLGLLATPARRRLRSRWPWLAVALAAALALPNILWQVAHGWPSLEFYRNAALVKNEPTSPLGVLARQALFVGPAALPVVLAGLVHLYRRRALRHLALAALVLLAFLVVTRQSRADRLAGLYPFLAAAGGAAIGRLSVRRAAVGAVLVAATLPLAPLVVPVFRPATVAAYAGTLGLRLQVERGAGKRTLLPQWLADRLGWDQLADDVRRVVARLSPEEQRKVVIFAPSYGPAGLVDRLGIAPVYCTHNSWFLWGPPRGPVDVAIVLGEDPEQLSQLFEQVELAWIHDCDLCMPWRNQMPIWIVRRARVDIAKRWPSWKHYE